MLARKTKLQHPSGATLELPCVVPSFTSKGFPFTEPEGKTKRTYSVATNALEFMNPFIKGPILLSAYDLHHRFFQRPQRFYKDKEMVFIDSGGYELSPEYDSTEPKQPPYTPLSFTLDQYRDVLKRLPKGVPFAITNFDWEVRGTPFETQILLAQQFFNDCPDVVRNFLVKPLGRQKGRQRYVHKYVDIDGLIAHVQKLRVFHILGVTEKELGRTLLDRLVRLAKLRAAMDRESVDIPIHVWGGLDPVLTPLYFFAGAEVFDGVSWLRYAYHNGTAVYRDSYGILKSELGLEASFDQARAMAMSDNYSCLQRLTTSLRRFADSDGQSFDMFDWHAAEFERAYAVLCTRIPDLK